MTDVVFAQRSFLCYPWDGDYHYEYGGEAPCIVECRAAPGSPHISRLRVGESGRYHFNGIIFRAQRRA